MDQTWKNLSNLKNGVTRRKNVSHFVKRVTLLEKLVTHLDNTITRKKWVTLWKIGHTLKNGSLRKNSHTYKNKSHLKNWVILKNKFPLGKMGQTLKRCSHMESKET